MFQIKLPTQLLMSAFVPASELPFRRPPAPAVEKGVATPPAGKVYTAPQAVIDKIKDEGMNRSQVMQTLSYLTDVIGARLTGSPSLRHANEWTRDTMAKWGMQNAHLEAWGPFGRGWVLKGFSAQVSSPYAIPLIAYPKAWAPGTNGVLNADVVYLDAKDDAASKNIRASLRARSFSFPTCGR